MSMSAKIVECDPTASAKSVADMLGLQEFRAAMILAGSAQLHSQAHEEKARSIIEMIFEVSKDSDSICILDGGIDTGIMAMAAHARAKAKSNVPLIGVAPKGVLTDDPNAPRLQQDHSHLIVVRGETWGSETQTLIDLSKEFGKGSTILILLGGGENATVEVVTAIRSGIPVYAVEGTGGIAEDLALRRHPQTNAAHLIKKDWLQTMVHAIEASEAPRDLAVLLSQLSSR